MVGDLEQGECAPRGSVCAEPGPIPFRFEVVTRGRLLWTADAEAMADIESLTLRRYWDLQPLLERDWASLLEQLAEARNEAERRDYEAAWDGPYFGEHLVAPLWVEMDRFVLLVHYPSRGGRAMVRTLGCYLGIAYLVSGVAYLLKPRLGFGLWEGRLRPYLPDSVSEVGVEYTRLSDRALRYLYLSYMLDGGLMLWLAFKRGS